MDLNTIALWFGALPALILFVKSLRGPSRPRGWTLVSGLVLLSAILGWFFYPASAGYVSATLLLLFVLLPSWAQRAAGRASNLFEYRRARRLLTVAAVLHPLDGWLSMPRLMETFELARAGKIAEAEAQLSILAQGRGSIALLAKAQRLRVLGRWDEIKELAEQTGVLQLGRDPTLLVLYLRALGELGQAEALAEFMLRHERTLQATGSLDAALLYLFAFTGHVELTRQALGGARRIYTDEARDFWLAVASKCQGDLERARLAFKRLRECADPQVRDRAERYYASLSHASPDLPPPARTRFVVTHFARSFAQRQQLLPNAAGQTVSRQLTLLLVIVNSVVYVCGSYPLWFDTRAEFGERWAFFAPDIASGEWWRAFSYLFVHANAVHLAMNMVGLWSLGPFIERAFGRLRFAVIYLCAGFTGSAVYLALSWYEWIEPQPLVGASGCIMGLLGATAAVMLRAWIRQRAAIARQMFLRLLAIVALQVAFDLSTPQVAGLAHALGLLGGFFAALLLHEGVSPERSVAPLSEPS